jgi:hypothetical protein
MSEQSAEKDAPPRCDCSASHPHKGQGSDPARCPVHGDLARVIPPGSTEVTS